MNTQSINQIGSVIATSPWLMIIIVWSLVWKLLALWKSARNNQLTWFIVMGVVNTAGLLEISYLIWMYFKEKKEKNRHKTTQIKKRRMKCAAFLKTILPSLVSLFPSFEHYFLLPYLISINLIM